MQIFQNLSYAFCGAFFRLSESFIGQKPVPMHSSLQPVLLVLTHLALLNKALIALRCIFALFIFQRL